MDTNLEESTSKEIENELKRIAKFFSQTDIDLFKECFFFIAKRGYTQDEHQMGQIMRSLSYSPTEEEIKKYFQKYVKAHDTEGRGYVQTNEVKNILANLGEQLTKREVDALFRDGGVNGSQLRYQDFINNISQPVPDY
ncbi:CALL4-like protein [Mya arenaria]|uniref:CALL4-like protein n=1 Tax=Mya arenaria TaxID=6604 RepID=A0ABY7G8Y5_MYAAR|nr:CALL4-like protein [Mya arenaria]WAR29900.1 CALL4-like protein [Mya arenaria]